MSTLTVTNINTASGTTDLTISTGNTNAGKLGIYSNGSVVISPNSTINSVIISVGSLANTLVTNSSGITVGPNSIFSSNATFSGTTTTFNSNTVLGGTSTTISGNTTFSGTTATINPNTTIGGTSTFTGNTTFSGTLQTISGNVNIDTGTLFVDGINNRVGISNTTPDTNLTITGSANVSANLIVGNYVTANVFSGAAPYNLSPKVTVATVAGTFVMAPTISTAAVGSLAITANRQYFIPIYVPYVLTTTNLACEVTVLGTSSSIRMNIYASDSNGSPTGSPLGTDVNVSSASTGVKSGAFAITMKPGIYWASMVCNATAPTIRTLTAPATIGISTLGTTSIYSYIYGTFTFGTMGAYSGVTSITGVAAATQTPMIAIY